MGSALWIAISGLNSSSKQMDVIGNNIANSNTMGFKSGKAYFANVLSQSLSGGSSGLMQIGQGVNIADVATQFSQGSLESTTSGLDLAIDGSGFFIVEDDDSSQYFTRAGAMHIDGEGYLVDINDYRVQGYAASSATLGDINTSGAQSEPETSTTFSVGVNLDARAEAGDTFNSSQTVYDSLGAAHTLAVTYMKTGGAGQWGIAATLDGVAATAQTYTGIQFDAYGNMQYMSTTAAPTTAETSAAGTASASIDAGRDGQVWQDGAFTLTYTSATSCAVASTQFPDAEVVGYTAGTGYVDVGVDLDGSGGADITVRLSGTWAATETATVTLDRTAATPANNAITFGALSNGATIGVGNTLTWDMMSADAETITGYASTSTVKALTNDGYPSGVLRSLAVEKDGTITGYFTNGQTTSLGQVALADFANPWGLKKMGQNLFSSTLTSGQAIVNTPGSGGLGEVKSSSLEMSNTDIGTEFINMITAQRAYQANAKVITTTDDMMTALMNTKR